MIQRKADYINNATFTKAVNEWAIKNKAATTQKLSQGLTKKEIKQPVVIIPDNIIKCFMRLVENISSKPNFKGYTYIEDMRNEAIIVCIRYAHNFNIEKSQNAFAYFSQFIFNSFVQYLKKEKKRADDKFEMVKNELNNADRFNYKNIVSSNSNDKGDYIDPENGLVFPRTRGIRKARAK